MSKIPVNDVFDAVEMMLKDRWGYIYGTAGILWTQSRQNTTTNEMAQRYGSRWIGHMVTDCSGVMVYIWKKHGLKIPHGSNSIRRQSVGLTQLTPEPGYAAFKVKKTDFYHIGIVGADGATVYEARGTQAGFVTSNVDEWDCFAPFNDVDYSGEVVPVPETGKQVNYRAEVSTASGSLNLRSGPGTKYPIVERIPKGKMVDVWMEYPDGWDFVSYMGDQGYVSAQYLTPLPPATSVPETSSGADAPPSPEGKATRLLRADGVTIELAGEWTIAGE